MLLIPFNERSGLRARIAVAAIFGLVIFAVSFFEAKADVYRTVVKLYVFHLLAWPLFLGMLLRKEVRAGIPECIIGTFIVLNALMMLFAEYADFSQGAVLNFCLFGAWFMCVRNSVLNEKHREQILLWVYILLTFLSLTGLVFYWIVPELIQTERPYRMRFPTCLENSFAALLVPGLLLSCFFVWKTVQSGKFRWKTAALAAFFIQAAAFASARSITAYAALAAGCALYVCVYLYSRGGRRMRTVIVLTVCAGVVAAAGAGIWMFRNPRGTFVVRRLCWEGGGRMCAARVWGYGPGNANPVLPDYIDPAYRVTPGFGENVFHLHNEYLEIAAETGIFGLLLFLAFLLYTLRAYLRSFTEGFSSTGAAGAGFAGLCVTLIAGVSMRLWTLPVLFWMLAALAPHKEPYNKKRIPGAVRATIAAAAFVLAVFSYRAVFCSWKAERALARSCNKELRNEELIGILEGAGENPLLFRDTLRASMRTVQLIETGYSLKENASARERIMDELDFVIRNHAHYIYEGISPFYVKAFVLVYEGEFRQAFISATRAFRYDPFSHRNWKRLMVCAIRYCGIHQNDPWEDAVRKLERITPDMLRAGEKMFVTALIAAGSGRYGLASGILRTGEKEFPGHLTYCARLKRGEILGMHSDAFRKGLSVVDECLIRYPADRDALAVLKKIIIRGIDMLCARKEWEQALYLAERLEALDPKNSDDIRQRKEAIRSHIK